MNSFQDVSKSPLKLIKVDTLSMGDISNQETRAIFEILLELSNQDFEVLISDLELRTLLDIYMRMYKAEPFEGLRELIEHDTEVELFFLDLCDLVQEEDVSVRLQLWVEAYKSLQGWVKLPNRASFGGISPQAEELLAHTQELLVFEHQWNVWCLAPTNKLFKYYN